MTNLKHTFRQTLQQKLRSGQKPFVGTLITLPCAEVAEILARLSFDWLWIDLEHGNLDFRAAQMLVQAIGERCAAIVRVASQDETGLKKVLDIGVNGVIIPQVKTATEAQRIVDLCLYPPQGTRGVGIARAQGYGITLQDYLQHANENTAIILQIEHIDAVNNIDEILAVPGIDAVMIGPYDLSGSLQRLGDTQHPDVIHAIYTVLQSCTQRQIPAGIFCATPDQATHWHQQGIQLVAIGADVSFLWRAAQQALVPFRS